MRSELARSIGQLAVALLLVGVFFARGVQLPFGSSISLFDLLAGTLSGGTSQPARVVLMIAFIAVLVFLGASVRRVLRAKHVSVA